MQREMIKRHEEVGDWIDSGREKRSYKIIRGLVLYDTAQKSLRKYISTMVKIFFHSDLRELA